MRRQIEGLMPSKDMWSWIAFACKVTTFNLPGEMRLLNEASDRGRFRQP